MILGGCWGSVEAAGHMSCLLFLFTLAAGEMVRRKQGWRYGNRGP